MNRLFDRKYTVIFADRANGLTRRFTLRLRPTLSILTVLVTLPVLMILGAKRSARYEIDQLRTANSELQIENASYRTATGELTHQCCSIQRARVVENTGS